MKFALIDANGAGDSGRAIVEWVPASVRCIAGVLEGKGLECDVLLVEDIPASVSDADCYLMTGMSSDIPAMRRAASFLGDKPLVIGGPVTFNPKAVFDDIDPDIAVIGEGERPLSMLLEGGLEDGEIPEGEFLSGVEGVAYRGKNGVKINHPRGYMPKEEWARFSPSTECLASYPFLPHIGVVLEPLRGCSNFCRPRGYHGKPCAPGCSICSSGSLTSRLKCPASIPAGCGFCSVAGLYGPPKSREQMAIVKEIKGLIDSGARRISFLVPDPLDYKREELVAPEPLTDPTFPEPNYVELEKLCKMIWDIPEISSGEAMVTIRDVKATMVTPKSARLVKEYFPNSIIGLGCESGSEGHCIDLGRGYAPRAVLRAAELLNELGIKPKVNLIVGLPGQNRETVSESLEFMRALRGKVLYFDMARFEALPMSAFEAQPSDFGPVSDEDSRALFEEGARSQVEFLERFIGARLQVAIGVYGEKAGDGGGGVKGGSAGPRRRFRQLAGVVGYPIFEGTHLSLVATVVKIINPEANLKTGDVRTVEITGTSRVGFRVVMEGVLLDSAGAQVSRAPVIREEREAKA